MKRMLLKSIYSSLILILLSSVAAAHDSQEKSSVNLELKCKQYYLGSSSSDDYQGYESFIIVIDKEKEVGYLDWDGIRAELVRITDHKFIFSNSVTLYDLNRITLEIRNISFRFDCEKAQPI